MYIPGLPFWGFHPQKGSDLGTFGCLGIWGYPQRFLGILENYVSSNFLRIRLVKILKFCVLLNDLLSKPNCRDGFGESPVDLVGKNF